MATTASSGWLGSRTATARSARSARPTARGCSGNRRSCTPPLEENLEVVGYPEVVLHAASSAPDTDFFARLVDDDPEGRAPEVCYGMVRARHRNSLDREELLTPGAVTEYRIRLGATACCFRTGHRLRLETTSSDFPNHDRNHNTGKNDLADTELRVAQQQVFHTVARPSRLIVAAG